MNYIKKSFIEKETKKVIKAPKRIKTFPLLVLDLFADP